MEQVNTVIENNMDRDDLEALRRAQKQAKQLGKQQAALAGDEPGETEFERRKRDKEARLQLRFQKTMDALRVQLEHAHFAKPVCPFCKEAVKAAPGAGAGASCSCRSGQ